MRRYFKNIIVASILLSIVGGLLAPVNFSTFENSFALANHPCSISGEFYDRQQDIQTNGHPCNTNITVDAFTKPSPADKKEGSCSVWDHGLFACAGYYIFKGFAWLMGIAGVLLDKTIQFTVLELGYHLNSDVGATIEQFWGILRNLANILLIFSTLFIGILIILRVDWFGMRNALVGIIAAALLINFSLFFTKVVIDVSNYFSVVFLTQMTQSSCVIGGVQCSGISHPFAAALGAASMFEPGTGPNGGLSTGGNSVIQDMLKNSNSFLIFLLGSIVFIVLGYGFLIAAFHLIGRFIMFILLMVTSPLAILGAFIPPLRGIWSAWWERLWKNAILVPTYFIILWLVFQTMIALTGVISRQNGGYPSFTQFATNPTAAASSSGAPSLLLVFIIIIGLSLLALSVARAIGTHGTKVILAAASRGRKELSAALSRTRPFVRYSGAGLAARETVGKVATGWDKRLSQNRFFGGSAVGEAIRKATVGATAGAKFGTTQSYKDTLAGKKVRAGVRQAADDRDVINQGIQAQEAITDPTNPTKNPYGFTTTELQEQVDSMERKVRALNQAELEALGPKALPKIADKISSGMAVALLDPKNEKLSEKDKAEFKKARYKTVIEAVEAAQKATATGTLTTQDDALRVELEKLNDNELHAALTEETIAKELKTVAKSLTEKKLESVEKSDKFTSSVKKELGDAQKTFLKESLALGAAGTFASDLKKLKISPKEMGDFVVEVHNTVPADLSKLVGMLNNSKVLQEMMDAGADATIRSAVVREVNAAGADTSTNPNIRALHKWLTDTPAGRIFSS